MVLDGKSLQEYPDLVNAGVPQGSNLKVLHFSCYILMTFLMLPVILSSMLIILLSTLNVIRHLI